MTHTAESSPSGAHPRIGGEHSTEVDHVLPATAHPRIGGEHQSCLDVTAISIGSPPHRRGTLFILSVYCP